MVCAASSIIILALVRLIITFMRQADLGWPTRYALMWELNKACMTNAVDIIHMPRAGPIKKIVGPGE